MADTSTSHPLLDDLVTLRAEIDEAQARVADLYARRVAIFVALRSEQPPMTQRRIAEAAGIHEVAVIQALKRHRDRDAASPAGNGKGR